MQQIYDNLFSAYGNQGWWPLSKGSLNTRHHNGNPCSDADRFEIITGAILTQNTSWTNVEKAIYNLNKAKVLSADKIVKADVKKIALLIKPAGYYNQKAARLKIIADYFLKNKKVFLLDAKEMRKELLKVNGIGPETADSIVLYAFEKPSFVIDAYTRRIFSRMKLCNENDKYEEIQKAFEDKMPLDVELFKEYHALIVEHAKRHCKNKPVCENCVLKKKCAY
ncbi:MAG: endonuclease [Candidatus Nanoarchaeia archaeon]|nr:endonuclease [Candidatus Nanoarchaeia archaeon]